VSFHGQLVCAILEGKHAKTALFFSSRHARATLPPQATPDMDSKQRTAKLQYWLRSWLLGSVARSRLGNDQSGAGTCEGPGLPSAFRGLASPGR
jgi:hypothetical protein